MIRLAVLCLVGSLGGDLAASTPTPEELARRLWDVTEVVLNRHVAPPSRSRMILAGLEGCYAAARVAPPPGLAERVSALSSAEGLATLIAELPRPPVDRPGPPEAPDVRRTLIDSMLRVVPGGARLLSAKEASAEEQIAGNRYVGLQIGLGFNTESSRPSIREVYEGGPADRAGLQAGELIEEIDGLTTADLKLPEVLDRLRGPEGSSVTIRVRGPTSSESRSLSIVRRELARRSVKGVANGSDPLLPGPERIGYLRLEQVVGSTPSEFRAMARRLEAEGSRGLILDLRPLRLGRTDFHATVLLADCLLAGGTIGRLRGPAGRVITFRAGPDAVLRGRPVLLLIDPETPAMAFWLAAALRDNQRAILVGRPRPGLAPIEPVPGRRPGGKALDKSFVRSIEAVGDGALAIELVTGRIERAHGQSFDANVPPPLDITVRPQARRVVPGESVVEEDPILTEALRHLRERLR